MKRTVYVNSSAKEIEFGIELQNGSKETRVGKHTQEKRNREEVEEVDSKRKKIPTVPYRSQSIKAPSLNLSWPHSDSERKRPSTPLNILDPVPQRTCFLLIHFIPLPTLPTRTHHLTLRNTDLAAISLQPT
jgi:hypothetical protein